MRKKLVVNEILGTLYVLFFAIGLGAFFIFGGIGLYHQGEGEGIMIAFGVMGGAAIVVALIPHIIKIKKILDIDKAFKRELETGRNDLFQYSKPVSMDVSPDVEALETDNQDNNLVQTEQKKDDTWIVG